MSDSILRSKLIRLASAHPEFRKDLLPLLKTGFGTQERERLKEKMDRASQKMDDLFNDNEGSPEYLRAYRDYVDANDAYLEHLQQNR